METLKTDTRRIKVSIESPITTTPAHIKVGGKIFERKLTSQNGGRYPCFEVNLTRGESGKKSKTNNVRCFLNDKNGEENGDTVK